MFAYLIALAASVALGGQILNESAWTWTLYEDAPIVLANEVPDTANLRSTLECAPGSSVALLTLYGSDTPAGVARITAGTVSALAEVEPARAGTTKMAVRTDHPVFAAFAVDGKLTITVGEQRRAIEVPAAHLAKLRRFAELCSG
ncbi:hypothetical protein [Brevundimonas lenta]|uniref:Uncharacterized protein n=1 Tax=Brevundimonas lenta TaxID=424796 RepID=A0A7W6JE36_9CAUL|nr:hypothetical protein [Brevundimonas lenta]MBB4082471.1 hypothetical protein [Brevundimonas lenta]